MALFPARPGREAGSSRAVKGEVDAMTVNAVRETAGGTARNPYDWPSPPDPGDLSRRLAARRAELRLSVSQVAERAAVNRRYLEFLESFPGQPDAGTLRRLAAALRTTAGALLGGGGQAPPGRRPGRSVGSSGSAWPNAAGCWRLAGSAGSPSAPSPG